MRKIWHFIILVIVIYGISKFCQYQTDGFAMTKLSTQFLDTPISQMDESLLKPSFRYLGKGGQSYVFVSEDGKYILKFFRSSRLNTLKLLYFLIPCSFFKKKIEIQKDLIKETLESYAIAKQHLQTETALLGIHLDLYQQLSCSIHLIDRLGITHTINPNSYPFVIQNKVILLKDQIKNLMERKKQAKAYKALKSLFSLILLQIEKGIQDQDPNLSKNFGFYLDQPVQIDGGRYKKTKQYSKEKIEKSKEDFQNWINKYYPQLSESFHKCYEEFLYEAI